MLLSSAVTLRQRCFAFTSTGLREGSKDHRNKGSQREREREGARALSTLQQMRHNTRKQGENFWPKIVLRKWLNISTKASDFSADEGDNEGDNESEYGYEEMCGCERDEERILGGRVAESNDSHSESRSYTLRRRKSETLRAQYINTKELRICVGTWNVGGKLPSDDLDIKDWLDMTEPADVYVLGLQEIVPLNAGNIFGAENTRPALRWEHLIRETLNKVQPVQPKVKCYSDPPSPSRFMPSDDAPVTAIDELLPGTDSDSDEEVHPLDEEPLSSAMHDDELSRNVDDSKCDSASTYICDADVGTTDGQLLRKQYPVKRLERCHCLNLKVDKNTFEIPVTRQKTLTKTLSSSERLGLVWPEQPLDLLGQHTLSNSFSFKSVKSFKACNLYKSIHEDQNNSFERGLIPDLNLEVLIHKKKRSPFVKIISKKMVGVFLSIWVRRSLRKHIQNLKVSTVGIGVMGYIGNKGSISVSMSIYQTLFCFVCSHLSPGEKEGDELRRNADVQAIHRRTLFNRVSSIGVPKTIHDHERIIWLGDLNYRLNLSYEKTHELIHQKQWYQLAEKDQLKRELKKGRAFDGWSEGVLNFPPTYKYEFKSEKYIGDDPKVGRRTPAWCDRILSFGNGLKLFNYKRTEMRLSDHRPVTAIYAAEVEIFCHRKLQKALTLTDAEIEDGDILPDLDIAP